MRESFKHFSFGKYKCEENLDLWQIVNIKSIPKSPNETDNNMFTCFNIELLSLMVQA